MSNVAGKDDNATPIIFGVSHLDGRTPVQIKFNPSNRGMKVDLITTIAFDPSIDATTTGFNYPLAKATSDADDSTIRPWVVNANTGAVIAEEI